MWFQTVYFLLAAVLPVLGQQYFITQIPAYSSLAQCAQSPINAIVQDMSSGCSGSQSTSSYSCFCGSSSRIFSGMIASDVSSACAPGSLQMISTAADAFSSYCALSLAATGSASAGTTTTATATSSASSHGSSGSSPSMATSTGGATATSSSGSSATATSSSSSSSNAGSSFRNHQASVAVGLIAATLPLALWL